MTDQQITDFFSNEPNTGLISVISFEEILDVKYNRNRQVDFDFHFPVVFYELDNELVGYYDLEMKQGFIL